MREIKFRAWDKVEKYLSKPFQLEDIDNGEIEEGTILLSECELMQYTGLKDKNGKEIYEGDIYKDYYAGKCKPKEEKFGKITIWEGEPTIKVFRDIRNSSYFKGVDLRYYEVIGNIYENPELLK